MRARIRGIYSTALTDLFRDEGWEIVLASDPIDRRYDDAFARREPDVRIETDADRVGVSIVGDPDRTAAAVEVLESIAIDTFTWSDPTPTGAIYDGTIDRTSRGGAIVDLGEGRSGYLPFDAVDGYVDVGDRLRVQIRDCAPPWAGDRPTLAGTIRAPGSIVSLVAGEDDDVLDAPNRETAGLVDLLTTDVPETWGSVWSPGAADADIEALDEALARVRDRADRIEAALDGRPDPGEQSGAIVEPLAGSWCWFGGTTRRALDDRRRSVVPTMTGHHRIKVIGATAGAAVDFVEAVCPEAGDIGFPFDAVLDGFGPKEGDRIAIEHGKPDGRWLTLGRGEVVKRSPNGSVTVTRSMTAGGSYDGLDVPKEDGDLASTTVVEGRWWYPTVYRNEQGDRKGTYVNVGTPAEIFPDAVRYVDLYVDVLKHANGRVERVDDDELDAAVEAGCVRPALAEKARTVATAIERALSK